MKSFVRVAFAGVLATLLGTTAGIPSKALAATDKAALAALAKIPSAEREARLVALAKEAGPLMLYTTSPLPEAQQLANVFTETYGIDVQIYRGGSTGALVHRILTEGKAGRLEADVLVANDNVSHAVDSKGCWVSSNPRRMSISAQNTASPPTPIRST